MKTSASSMYRLPAISTIVVIAEPSFVLAGSYPKYLVYTPGGNSLYVLSLLVSNASK